MTYTTGRKLPAKEIADLREAVGWNRMEEAFTNKNLNNLFELGCQEGGKLTGYLNAVSNKVTDAYIQDVMVVPEYQRRGIGTELMKRALLRIKEMDIYMVSVIYGEETLRPFYEKFGFCTMLCGQVETDKVTL